MTDIFNLDQIRKGTHITAMGSDTPEKNELEPEILRAADIVVADSISRCRSRGEISGALKAGLIEEKDIQELGQAIIDEKLRRTSEDQVTVADLTEVAVQDLQISKTVYHALVCHK